MSSSLKPPSNNLNVPHVEEATKEEKSAGLLVPPHPNDVMRGKGLAMKSNVKLSTCVSNRFQSKLALVSKASKLYHANRETKRGSDGRDPFASASSKRLDEDMNHHNLKELEAIFREAANTDGEDGLDMDQFRVAMKRTMGEHIDDNELDMIFMKVDTNCDGTVDWDEYLSYMLLEYQEKENMESMAADCPFPNPMIEKPCNHLESICRITMLTAYSRKNSDGTEIDDSGSRYLTLSKEGVLNIWSMDWTLQKSTTFEGSSGTSKSVWLTDMVCLSNCNCVAVASTDYEISFYSLTSNLIQKKFQIRGLEQCALSLDFSFDVHDPRRSIFIWGDTSGSVYIMRMYENPNICLYTSSNQPTVSSLLKGNVPNVVATHIPRVHSGWVQQVRYYASKKGQECFISGCVSEEGALHFADITPKVAGAIKEQHISINRRSSFTVRKGVLCLDYDPDWNLIVTGSRDCDVRVWNPYVEKKSSAILKGHSVAVTQVHVRGVDRQIISISKDKNIRVWDLRDYSCKQNVHGRNVNLGRLDVSAMYVNERHKELILATNQLGIFRPRNPSVTFNKRQQTWSHQKPISCVLYNKLFKQIVTGGDDAMVCIWDIKTGAKTMQFCTETDVEIATMAFDPTNRRLATGSRNGSIALWNFNNGACLRRLRKTSDLENAGVIFCKHRIVSAGWDKQITSYADSYEDESFRRFRRSHGDDIMSIVYHTRDSTVASASYDGDIFVWSLDTEDVIVALNMHESILPIHLASNGNQGSTIELTTTTAGVWSNLHGITKRSNAWSSKLGSPTDSSRENVTKIQNRIDRWLPDYLPWVNKKENEINSGSDSDEDYSDTASNTSSKLKGEGHESIQTDRVVNKLLFLQGRHNDENTAVLLAAVASGLIAAWSIHQKGGLLAYFEGTQLKNEVVLSMESDKASEYLITGDSRGHLKMWDISTYCTSDFIRERRETLDANSSHSLHGNSGCYFTDGRFTRPTYEPYNQPPPLLWSIRCHTSAITAISYIKERQLIVSGSTDCSVRLWTTNGRYIGTFGQRKPWNVQFPISEKDLPVAIPEDVRRVGSPNTLRLIKGGFHTQWKQVKNAVKFFGKVGAIFSPPVAKKPLEEDPIREQFTEVNKNLLKESSARRGTVNMRRGSVTVWMEDSPHSILAKSRPVDQVEMTYQRLSREGIKSSVLGNVNYKPKRRHKESTIDRVIKWSDKHPIVYNSLPYSEIETPLEPPMPQCLRKKEHGLAKHANVVIARQRALGFLRQVPSPDRSSANNRKSATKGISPCPSASTDTRSAISLATTCKDAQSNTRVHFDLSSTNLLPNSANSCRLLDVQESES